MAPAAARSLESFAIVQDDGTLSVEGVRVRLAGLLIPKVSTVCTGRGRRLDCFDVDAATALERKITSFVHCAVVAERTDGSVDAYCSIQGRSSFDPRQDLGAWLVSQGYAAVLPGAPASYRVLERIARSQGIGIWSDAVEVYPP